MLASKWLDMVIGVDIHFEMVPTPAGPIPTPFPNPFIGLVFDPAGLAVGLGLGAAMALATGGTPTGPVLINCMPATNVGTEAKGMGHILIPPGVSWVPMPKFPKPSFRGPPDFPGLPIKPEDDAVSIMGSTTVSIMGSSAVRMGEMWMSCGEPLRLPSSVVLVIPAGPLVLVGGPPGVNLMDALLAAIRTKWVAGYLHSVISRIKNTRLRNVLAKAACFLTGHPVDVASGRVLTDNVDFELPGPLPLKFERNYASSWGHRDSPLGFGWSHSLDQAIWFERGKVVYLAEDGREIEFDVFDFPDHALGPGQEVYDPINQLTLRFRRNDLIEIESADGETREFAPSSVRLEGDRAGWWRLQRRRSRARHEIVLNYDARGDLLWVRDSSGRQIGFEHDAQHRLIRVRLPHPTHDDFIDQLRYAYDADGDLVQVTDVLGSSWTFAYKRHLLVRETNRNGLSFYFAYDGWGPEANCVRTWGDGGIYDHVIDYSKGQLTVVTNSLGFQTAYKLNAMGQVVEVVDAAGRATRYEYDERSLKLLKETAADGSATQREYDPKGNVVKVTQPDGAEVRFEYANRDLVRVVDALGGEWRWAYDSLGRVVARANPLGERSQFHWGERGLVAVTDQAGQHTQLTHDAAGNISSVTSADGTVNSWQYDRQGRWSTSTDGNGNTVQRTRDLAGRLRRIQEADGNVRELSYDAEGNVLRAWDNLYDVAFEYRGLNRLTARTQSGTRLEFHYDTEERLTGLKNEHGFVYHFRLGPTGDVEEELSFDRAKRRYQRDAAGRVSKSFGPDGKPTNYAYDKVGRLIGVRYSDGSAESYDYRADGALIGAINDTARVVFERDPLGRVTRELTGDDWVSSEYDALGQRKSLRSSRGLYERIRRNAVGDVVALDADLPRAASDTHSQNAVPSFSARFERDRLGLEVERSLPGGVRARWQRDSVGRPVRHEIWRGTAFHSAKQYSWDVNDRLKRVIDALSGPVEFTHDTLGNLAASTYADGRVDLRMPDAVGNLFRSQDRSDRKYGPSGQLLEARDARGVTTYEYDAEGNLIKKITPDGGTWGYHWSRGGLLVKVVRPSGHVVEFGYDALARRIAKTYRGKTTRWIWDGNVPLHEWVERSADAVDEDFSKPQAADAVAASERALKALLTGRPANGPPDTLTAQQVNAAAEGSPEAPITWLFEPESFAPLAKIVGNERFGIVTDQLGTPIGMFDALGNEVWAAETDSYGDLHNLRGARQACPFRWPGQYEDAETGLHYNRWRYYDPSAGQYLRQDPIGLAGGLSLYEYVSDVNREVDLFGLKDKVFWSGGKAAKEAAEAYAKATGAEILEMTPTGSALEAFTKGMDWADAKPLWNKASQAFAGAAPSTQKKAIAFIDSRFYRGAASVWEEFEKPILEKKGIFTEVRDVAPCP